MMLIFVSLASHIAQGFHAATVARSKPLIEHFPGTPGDHNEPPNALVEL